MADVRNDKDPKKDLSAGGGETQTNNENPKAQADPLKAEAVVTTALSKGSSPAVDRKSTMREVDLKPGQVLIAMTSNPENEIAVSEQNWRSQYENAKNPDGTAKYKLVTEKKS